MLKHLYVMVMFYVTACTSLKREVQSLPMALISSAAPPGWNFIYGVMLYTLPAKGKQKEVLCIVHTVQLAPCNNNNNVYVSSCSNNVYSHQEAEGSIMGACAHI